VSCVSRLSFLSRPVSNGWKAWRVKKKEKSGKKEEEEE
jgi:hypothetical protein